MLNNPEDMLSLVLRGALGRSGRKRARRSINFLSGRGGFLTAGTLMTAAGIAWGIFDSLKGQEAGALTGATVAGSTLPPPIPVVPGTAIPVTAMDSVIRVVRLAVSAARADGTFTEQERAIILARAKEAGLESAVEAELAATYPLNEIVAGVTDINNKKDLYVLAFTIVRADETVTGAERIYLAQLAYQLGLDDATVAELEAKTSASIDAQPE